MPSNQNPVFTDDTTILGDGTDENPLHTAGSGGGAVVAKSANATNARVDIPSNGVPLLLDTLSIDIPAGNWKIVAYASLTMFVSPGTGAPGPGNTAGVSIKRFGGSTIAFGTNGFGQLDNTPANFTEVEISCIGIDLLTGPITGQQYQVLGEAGGNGMTTDFLGWSIEAIPA